MTIPISLLPAIRRLEFGPRGIKVTISTRTENIETPDGTVSTFEIRWREVLQLRNPRAGQPHDLIVRFPERMESEPWQRYFQALAAEEARERQEADFMDED